MQIWDYLTLFSEILYLCIKSFDREKPQMPLFQLNCAVENSWYFQENPELVIWQSIRIFTAWNTEALQK